MERIALAGMIALVGCTDGGGGGGGTGFSVSGRITSAPADRVMAVSNDIGRVLADVDGDGRFNLDLPPGHAWTLVLLDSSKVGPAMVTGTFRSDALDTLAPLAAGEADLGDLEVSDLRATGALAHDDLVDALGLDGATADYLGAVDDTCLRYSNPDIDGDGVVDHDQPDHWFTLSFGVSDEMWLATGRVTPDGQPEYRVATLADLVGSFLPADTSTMYAFMSAFAWFESSFYGGALPDTVSATFEQPVTYIVFPAGTIKSVAAGVPVPGVDMSGGVDTGVGPFFAPGNPLPQGTFRFDLGGEKTLTFTDVVTESDAQLAGAEELLAPFIRFDPTAGCTGDCALAGISYEWRKHTSSGWVAATPGELAVAGAPAWLSFRPGYDNAAASAAFQVPTDPASGTIAWSAAAAVALAGITDAELQALTASQICHLGLSYDNRLGMRMFTTIANADGTCPTQ
jgi:hypothetical protein